MPVRLLEASGRADGAAGNLAVDGLPNGQGRDRLDAAPS